MINDDANDDVRSGGIADAYWIGVVGFSNLTLLSLITLWRLCLYSYGRSSFKNAVTSKGFWFHMLLFLTTTTDLPMYVSFFELGAYEIKTYSFHKLESMFMFAALSITISDWQSVLHIIKEESSMPFLFKKVTLFVVNAIVVLVCIWNFVSCWSEDMDIMGYVQLPQYTVGIVTQFSSGLILTLVMLHGGLKLSRRIRGANGSARGVFANNYILSMFSEMCNVCKTALSPTQAPPTTASPLSGGSKEGEAMPEAPRSQSPMRHEAASAQLLANTARQVRVLSC